MDLCFCNINCFLFWEVAALISTIHLALLLCDESFSNMSFQYCSVLTVGGFVLVFLFPCSREYTLDGSLETGHLFSGPLLLAVPCQPGSQSCLFVRPFLESCGRLVVLHLGPLCHGTPLHLKLSNLL